MINLGAELLSRFIPAQAGNTCGGPRGASAPSVHPRAGGEHPGILAVACSSIGSSPRRRGTPSSDRSACRHPRFIPAQAGNTASGRSSPSRPPVHPRAGGEHIPPRFSFGFRYGSSPRRRGTLWHAAPFTPRPRFIPAQAGNTLRNPAPRPQLPVHPRAGGEHRSRQRFEHRIAGSSPRRRGTPVAAVPRLLL